MRWIRRRGSRGAGGNAEGPIPGTSEFFVDELALVLNGSARSAARLARDAYVLTERLPVVWAALADGELDWPRARVFIDVLATTAAGVAEAVSAIVLPAAVGLSLGRLRARLTREVLALDADAADERRREAEKRADVRVYPTADGMSELLSGMPSPVAAACWSTIDELAWMRKNDGDPRPIGQLRALTHAELILRPWDTSRPAVTAVLAVTAPLSSLTGAAVEPGEVNGRPITAAHVRELLEQLNSVCPGGLQAPTGGSMQISVTDADGVLRATVGRRSWSASPAAAALTIPSPSPSPRPVREQRLRVFGARPAAAGRPVPAHPGAAPLRHDPGSDLPPARLRATGRADRPGSRRPLRRGRRDRLRQPLLPVPPAPPTQDLRPGMAVRPHTRRPTRGHHPERGHPHDPAAGPARPHRTTGPARTTSTTGGTAAVLSRGQPRADVLPRRSGWRGNGESVCR